MGSIFWLGVLPACLIASWLILRHPVRQLVDEVHFNNARKLFRQQREWLEARFVGALGSIDAEERLRWEDAHWHDDVLWARDRQTRRLLALIGVHFDANPLDEPREPSLRHATALFEFRKGRWHAEGKRLDEMRPAEAVLRHQRFEAVVPHHPRRG
jgi:hypothetical protein